MTRMTEAQELERDRDETAMFLLGRALLILPRIILRLRQAQQYGTTRNLDDALEDLADVRHSLKQAQGELGGKYEGRWRSK